MILEIVNQISPDALKVTGIYALAWVFYLAFVTLITVTRAQIRSCYNINGNPVEDFFAVMFAYPCVMVQLNHVSDADGITCLLPDSTDQQNGHAIRLEKLNSDA